MPIRPDLVASVPLYLENVPKVPGSWELNPSAFSQVPVDPMTGIPTRLGTLGRNYLHGPNFWNLNFAFARSFPLYEKLHLDFRVDAFNLLNHPNFRGVDNVLGDPTFGQLFTASQIGVANPLYATGSPRSLQLSLNLKF